MVDPRSKTDDGTDLDRLIGSRVKEARGSVSQQEMAETLTADSNVAGRWYPNTVALVERGTRPLRLAEAVCIAGRLGVSLDWLTGAPATAEDELRQAARVADERLRRAHALLAELVDERDPLANPWEA